MEGWLAPSSRGSGRHGCGFDGVVASTGYAICSEPRSGSNFLCQALASTGVLGRPLDYFNGPGLRGKGWPDYPREPELQLQAVLKLGTTANGIYGLKMFSATFDAVHSTNWAERLPACHFIHLERRDLLGQAISDVRAVQTGRYRSTTAGRSRPVYDGELIRRRLHRIALGQARWRAYFAANAIQTLHLDYEDVATDPQAAVSAIASLVGVAERAAVDPEQIEVSVQRDAISDTWRERFLLEESSLAVFDSICGTSVPAHILGKARRLMRGAAGFPPRPR
jgi:LPS sulfotransferase NodH